MSDSSMQVKVMGPLTMARCIPEFPESVESTGSCIPEFPLSSGIEVGVQVSESFVADVSANQLLSLSKEPRFESLRNESPSENLEQSSSLLEESNVENGESRNSLLNPRAPSFISEQSFSKCLEHGTQNLVDPSVDTSLAISMQKPVSLIRTMKSFFEYQNVETSCSSRPNLTQVVPKPK